MENQNQSKVEVVSADLLKDIFSAAGLSEQTPPPTEVVKPGEEVIDDKTPLPPTTQTVELPKAEEKITIQTDHSKKLKSLIKDGIIDNFTINYKVDGEDQEVFLEDIEDLTEEGYQQILDGWKSATKEERDSKYISKDGLDDNFLKIIETRRAGGDITEIIRENVTAIDQLTQLKENIDNEQVQVNIVAHSLQQQGIKPIVVQAQIKALIDDGTLEIEANTILDSHLNIHQNAIEQKRQGELQRVEKEREELKNLRKNLSTTYKEMNLPESLSKILVDNATKLDQDKISNTDKLYFEAIKDPETYAKINFFLNNPEGFEKFISSKKVLTSKIESSKSLFTVNINKTNKPKTSTNTLNEFAEEAFKNNNQK